MVEVFIFLCEVPAEYIKGSGYLVLQVTIRFPAELRLSGNESDWRTHLLFPVYQVPGPRTKLYNEGGFPS
jgi:hypothetical protein